MKQTRWNRSSLCLMIGCIVLWTATAAFAAQPMSAGCGTGKSWNMDRAELYWEFTAIVDPPPTGFRVKAGTASNTYTVTRDVPATQFSMPLSVLLPGPGTYYTAVAPLYGTQEGGLSGECPFVAARPAIMLDVRPRQ